jgi:RNA polymerase sigma-70 factor (ECF subfamily)
MPILKQTPETRHSLIIRLRDPQDHEGWALFVRIYAPLVTGFLRRRGFQESDASDIAQEVFMSVAADIQHQQSNRPGAFRKWLFTIVQRRASDHCRRNKRQPRAAGDTRTQEMFAQLPDERADLEQQWDHAYLRHLFSKAAKVVKKDIEAKTWDAFCRTTIQQEAAQSVASRLKMSVASVYMAKRRVLKRIEQQVAFFEGDHK